MSLSPVGCAGSEAIASVCGIPLGMPCYCQAYRDGVAPGGPGVPGVGEGVLGAKVVTAEREAIEEEAEERRERT